MNHRYNIQLLKLACYLVVLTKCFGIKWKPLGFSFWQQTSPVYVTNLTWQGSDSKEPKNKGVGKNSTTPNTKDDPFEVN